MNDKRNETEYGNQIGRLNIAMLISELPFLVFHGLTIQYLFEIHFVVTAILVLVLLVGSRATTYFMIHRELLTLGRKRERLKKDSALIDKFHKGGLDDL